MEKKETKGMNVSLKSYLSGLIMILVLMVVTYILTIVIPSGSYERVDGVIDTSKGFSYTDASLPFWKFLLSPILVLTVDGSTTIIAVIAFLLVIGGIMEALNACGFMKYIVSKIVSKFKNKRYVLLCVLILFFMAMGAFVGSFEEVVPLVPFIVALAISLGFDALTGMYVSLVAVGCGFATGVLNPFTTGVAQELAGLQMFSGIWLRLVAFVLIYFLLTGFTLMHAKKIVKDVKETDYEFIENKDLNHAIIAFVSVMLIGITTIILSAFITVLQDYTLIIVAIMFLVAGVSSCIFAKMRPKEFFKKFLKGMIAILPAVLMILMASSIKYILVEGGVLDTILYYCVNVAEKLDRWIIILFIYLIALVLNFFIASGSAEAVVLIPLITPIAQIFGINLQLCVLAFNFGDGFSNVFYPTNPALLLSLGVADIPYTSYAKKAWTFQLANLVLTSLILLFGLLVNYS